MGAIAAYVISNNYFAADRFGAAIALGADRWMAASFWASEPDITLEVHCSVDGGISFTNMVQGAVDNIIVDPTAGIVHIEGRDRTASLIEARTQETFANRTSSEIAALLAGRHNLSCQATQTSTPVGRYYQDERDRITLVQFSRATTEWDLLVFLARHEGFDVFVQGDTLYFQPSSDAADLVLSVRPGDVTDLRLERSATLARDIEVVVKSWNSRQNSAFIQRARANRQEGRGRSSQQPRRYVYVRPNLTPDEALKFAQRQLAELTRHERNIRVSMPGDLVVSPRSQIALTGTGTDFDQTYYVDVVERRLHQDGGFTQHIRARNSSPRTGASAPTSSGFVNMV